MAAMLLGCSSASNGAADGGVDGSDRTMTAADAKTDAPPAPAADAGGSDAAGLDAWAQAMLAAQNAVRAGATPVPSPPLTPYTWSTTVAAYAQNWANQCQFEHSMGMYGENIYASTDTPTPQDVVSSWASEAADYDYATNSCSNVCGHYTQIVWRSSTEVGCAVASCTQNSPFGSGAWSFVVCDYDPAGNYVGQKPY
jgi:uncharacterized protein YkwD